MYRLISISDTHDVCDHYLIDHIKYFNPDVVLHNGDIGRRDTYDFYRSHFRDFRAIRGDHDSELTELPEVAIHNLAGYLVAQIHGKRSDRVEKPSSIINQLARGRFYYWNHFAKDMVSAVGTWVHIVLPGHLHVPDVHRVGDTVVINPGALLCRRSHHLPMPTLARIDLCSTGIYVQIYGLYPERPPMPLEMPACAPLSGWFPRVQPSKSVGVAGNVRQQAWCTPRRLAGTGK